MNDVTSISGPVEMVGGELKLRIPFAAGGEKLIQASRGIGVVNDETLVITIPSWLAEKLQIGAGSIVNVNNSGGKLNIVRESHGK